MSERLRRNGNPKTQIVAVSILVILIYWLLTLASTPDVTLLDVIKGVFKFVLFLWWMIPLHVWIILLDFGLVLFGGFLLWTAFFAQFSLPLQNLEQRKKAFRYLAVFAGNFLGIPIVKASRPVRIENGTINPILEDENHYGYSVVLLDTASAAVMRTPVAFTCSQGPGLVFLKRGEYIAGVVDLHNQIWPERPWGPLEYENPFEPQRKDETDEAYQERQNRRLETSGITRDGVEVVCNIRVSFRLDLQAPYPMAPDERNWSGFSTTEFGYNPEAVRRAVTGIPIDPNRENPDGRHASIPWIQLPANLAVDLWREYLRKFTLNELFMPLGEADYQHKTAFEVIHEKVRQRLIQPDVDEISPAGEYSRQTINSREYQVLKERGIRVIDVTLRNLCFPGNIDQNLENNWFSSWLSRAKTERNAIEKMRAYREHAGEQDAVIDFALGAIRKFNPEQLPETPIRSETEREVRMLQALDLLLRGTLMQYISNPEIHQRLQGEEKQILAAIDWLRRQEK